MRTLYGLGMSPWTEKARWALEHYRLEYRYHEHVPLLGEVFLRRLAKRAGAKPSVPLLVDGDDVVSTALGIAHHAERAGRGGSPARTTLFPEGAVTDVERWADLADAMLAAARGRIVVGVTRSRAAQREALPGFVPGPLRGVFSPMAIVGARFVGSKYDASLDADDAMAAKVRPSLDRVRAVLAGGRPYLLDEFSFADMAIAASLRLLRPEAEAVIGPGTREVWTHAALAEEYDDLVAWRDAIYQKHRRS